MLSCSALVAILIALFIFRKSEVTGRSETGELVSGDPQEAANEPPSSAEASPLSQSDTKSGDRTAAPESTAPKLEHGDVIAMTEDQWKELFNGEGSFVPVVNRQEIIAVVREMRKSIGGGLDPESQGAKDRSGFILKLYYDAYRLRNSENSADKVQGD